MPESHHCMDCYAGLSMSQANCTSYYTDFESCKWCGLKLSHFERKPQCFSKRRVLSLCQIWLHCTCKFIYWWSIHRIEGVDLGFGCTWGHTCQFFGACTDVCEMLYPQHSSRLIGWFSSVGHVMWPSITMWHLNLTKCHRSTQPRDVWSVCLIIAVAEIPWGGCWIMLVLDMFDSNMTIYTFTAYNCTSKQKKKDLVCLRLISDKIYQHKSVHTILVLCYF